MNALWGEELDEQEKRAAIEAYSDIFSGFLGGFAMLALGVFLGEVGKYVI